MTEVALLRGPLPEERLREITELYGSHDPKYGTADFCRYQFNQNPFGFSLHAFAYAGEEPIGHCSLIPLATRVGGTTRTTAKTEALFVHEDHRGRPQAGGEGESVAVAMVSRLYAFADTQDLPDIHSLGRPEFAKIHVAGGARVLEFRRRQFAFFLRPEAVGALLGAEVEPERAQGIFDRQRRRLDEVRSLLEGLAAERREVPPGEVGELDLAAFTELAPQGERWTVAPTEETAPWHLGSPALRRMRATSGEQRFDCVYSGVGSGSWLEIFDWRCREQSDPLALWAVCRLIEDAEREGRDLVCFFDWSRYNPSAGALRQVAERLGFESVERPRLIYVRSEDQAFATAERMSFSPYLYATF